MTTHRRPLPAKRHAETFSVPFGGFNLPHTVSVGFYTDGAPGEVFITGGKSGEMVEAIARDSAILLSLCLQHGVPLDTIKHALTRDGSGTAMSIIGVVVDRLLDENC